MEKEKGLKMKNYKVVVFDFDGVLTKGGEELKQSAWNTMTLPWLGPQARFLLEKQHELVGNGSRYDVLRESFHSFRKSDAAYNGLVDILTNAYAECYNRIVQQLLQQSGMPDGTENTLTKLAKGRNLFVNSATPEIAVRESVQNFNIAHFFRGVFGQPTSKVDNMARAQSVAEIDKKHILFVGDGNSDARAAEEFGCDFIGVANEWNKWSSDNVDFPLIKSVVELPAMLDK